MSEITLAKDFAINMIKPYVLRGETIQQMKAGHMGQVSNGNWCEIGGYLDKKFYSADYVIVSKIQGKDCQYVFKLQKLYDEILSPQMELLTV